MKLTREDVLKYSAQYDAETAGENDQLFEDELFNWFSSHKYLDRTHLFKLGMWKSPRAKNLYKHEMNTEVRVKELSAFALSSNDEYVRIMVPQIIKGVGWGVASVILHFGFPDEYMILDFRALWSLDWALHKPLPTQYTFDFWLEYTQIVREHAQKMNVTLRQLDKALWQYSKEYQSTQKSAGCLTMG